jgi:hypothetical protein
MSYVITKLANFAKFANAPNCYILPWPIQHHINASTMENNAPKKAYSLLDALDNSLGQSSSSQIPFSTAGSQERRNPFDTPGSRSTEASGSGAALERARATQISGLAGLSSAGACILSANSRVTFPQSSVMQLTQTSFQVHSAGLHKQLAVVGFGCIMIRKRRLEVLTSVERIKNNGTISDN